MEISRIMRILFLHVLHALSKEIKDIRERNEVTFRLHCFFPKPNIPITQDTTSSLHKPLISNNVQFVDMRDLLKFVSGSRLDKLG